MKRILIALLGLIAATAVRAAAPDTYVFDTCGSDTLRLDLYRAESEARTPLLIYVFGGGFKGGERRSESYVPMFDFLTKNGISVASIDYRTMLRYADPAAMTTPDGFRNNLIAAIDTATVDLFKATAFIVSRADEWNVDTTRVFTCGSSAGAITVLQAEYYLCDGSPLPGRCGLGAGFNYAGVISMAGAICSDGMPRWQKTPCPMLLFHGDADAIVPYEKAVLGEFGLWGSKTVSDTLAAGSVPHSFHIFNGSSHEIATDPMNGNMGEILDFVRTVSGPGLGRIAVTSDRNPAQGEYKTDFTIIDYIKANL